MWFFACFCFLASTPFGLLLCGGWGIEDALPVLAEFPCIDFQQALVYSHEPPRPAGPRPSDAIMSELAHPPFQCSLGGDTCGVSKMRDPARRCKRRDAALRPMRHGDAALQSMQARGVINGCKRRDAALRCKQEAWCSTPIDARCAMQHSDARCVMQNSDQSNAMLTRGRLPRERERSRTSGRHSTVAWLVLSRRCMC